MDLSAELKGKSDLKERKFLLYLAFLVYYNGPFTKLKGITDFTIITGTTKDRLILRDVITISSQITMDLSAELKGKTNRKRIICKTLA